MVDEMAVQTLWGKRRKEEERKAEDVVKKNKKVFGNVYSFVNIHKPIRNLVIL